MTLKHVNSFGKKPLRMQLSWLSECAELDYEWTLTLKKLKDSFDLCNILVSI